VRDTARQDWLPERLLSKNSHEEVETNIHKNQVPTAAAAAAATTTTATQTQTATRAAAPAVITRFGGLAVENAVGNVAKSGCPNPNTNPKPRAQHPEHIDQRLAAAEIAKNLSSNRLIEHIKMSDEASASPSVSVTAHLQSESYAASSPDEASSNSSQEEGDREENLDPEREQEQPKPRKTTQRSYNVAEIMEEQQDPVVLPEEQRHHSTTSNSSSSSSSSNSSSSSESCDSDDTGTVRDRRPKRRRFNKVFIVNRQPGARVRRSSSTEGDSLSSSEANLEDSSDNDTDTERTDCGIVLNYVKPLEEEAKKAEEEVDAPAARDCQSSDDEEEDDDESERRVANSSDELANCIVVVGGQTDDASAGVVLQHMRSLPDEGDHQQLERCHSQVMDSSDALAACDELHSISNDVNRLLELHKQNSQLEMKLQRLRQGVAEINEDLQLSKGDNSADGNGTHVAATHAGSPGKPDECSPSRKSPSNELGLTCWPEQVNEKAEAKGK